MREHERTKNVLVIAYCLAWVPWFAFLAWFDWMRYRITNHG